MKRKDGDGPPSDASRSQPVCNSIRDMCDFKGGGGGNCMLCHSLAVQMFEPGMALNFDRRVMNFLLRLGGT